MARLFEKDGIPHLKCRHCGFIRSHPQHNPNLTNVIAQFEPAYLEYLRPQPHDAKNFEWLISKIKKHKDLAGCRILDAGCGSGKFVRYLRRQGYAAYGLEPSKALYDQFLSGEEPFFHGTLTEHNVQQRFDIITIIDVLEHIDDPQLFVKAVTERLAPGGLVFISTPDSSSLPARLLKKRWHYYNRYHLSLFSRDNLRGLMAQHGFAQVDGGYVARYHSVHYMLQYMLNFVMRKKAESPRFLQGRVVRVNLFDNMYGAFISRLPLQSAT